MFCGWTFHLPTCVAEVGIFECLDADMMLVSLVTETGADMFLVESSGCQRLAQTRVSVGQLSGRLGVDGSRWTKSTTVLCVSVDLSPRLRLLVSAARHSGDSGDLSLMIQYVYMFFFLAFMYFSVLT